jgi:hypothetical protein
MIVIKNGTIAISAMTAMTANAATYFDKEPSAFCAASASACSRQTWAYPVDLRAARGSTSGASRSMCVLRKEHVVPFCSDLVARETCLVLSLVDRFAFDEPAKAPAARRRVSL